MYAFEIYMKPKFRYLNINQEHVQTTTDLEIHIYGLSS